MVGKKRACVELVLVLPMSSRDDGLLSWEVEFTCWCCSCWVSIPFLMPCLS